MTLQEGPFKWVTKTGEELYPRDMNTTHIFNAIKMMYNNLVAPTHRVGRYISWWDIKYWDASYIAAASFALIWELRKRYEFTRAVGLDQEPDEEQISSIRTMQFNLEWLYRSLYPNLIHPNTAALWLGLVKQR
jgi:hypothetical protein